MEVAVQRLAADAATGRQPGHGCRLTDAARIHLQGALAEACVADALGISWTGSGAAGDVGPYQVRSTTRRDGCLLLHDSDRPGDIFILVTVDWRIHRLVGWCHGGEGQLSPFWKDPKGGRPCYFVPQSHLHPMARLPKG